MNILYCGDKNIENGLLVSILSLLKNIPENLSIYVLTMSIKNKEKEFEALPDSSIQYLDQMVKQINEKNFVQKYDITRLVKSNPPTANMETRFTPYCMLRLYADLLPELPDRILYLDNDVICRKKLHRFYNQDMKDYELAGVLDYYGQWFFRKHFWEADYINSGVLLLNLKKIRETKLFEQCRTMCQKKQMFMPDQSAINKLCQYKKLLPRKYNEQRKLKKETVIQHFTTSFRFFPWVHTITVKPWDIERVHKKLKIYEYDDIFEKYKKIIMDRKGN